MLHFHILHCICCCVASACVLVISSKGSLHGLVAKRARVAGGRDVAASHPAFPAAQVLFTAELRRRLPGGCGVVAAAVHPGEVMTDVVRTLPRPLQAVYRVSMLPFCLTPAEGAAVVALGSAQALWF